jgi:uncharacterized protein (DUF433 family)
VWLNAGELVLEDESDTEALDDYPDLSKEDFGCCAT